MQDQEIESFGRLSSWPGRRLDCTATTAILVDRYPSKGRIKITYMSWSLPRRPPQVSGIAEYKTYKSEAECDSNYTVASILTLVGGECGTCGDMTCVGGQSHEGKNADVPGGFEGGLVEVGDGQAQTRGLTELFLLCHTTHGHFSSYPHDFESMKFCGEAKGTCILERQAKHIANYWRNKGKCLKQNQD